MNAKKVVLYTLGAVASIFVFWLIFDNKKKSDQIDALKKSNEEKDEINQKLQDTIENSNEIPENVKLELEKLIQKYKDIDFDLSQELQAASSLIGIGAYPKAIGSLTKIIENLLKEKYKNDEDLKASILKKGRKSPVLADYLEKAKESKILTQDEFHFANGLREIRNEDAHKLNPQKSKMLTASAFLFAVDIILKLSVKLNLAKLNINK